MAAEPPHPDIEPTPEPEAEPGRSPSPEIEPGRGPTPPPIEPEPEIPMGPGVSDPDLARPSLPGAPSYRDVTPPPADRMEADELAPAKKPRRFGLVVLLGVLVVVGLVVAYAARRTTTGPAEAADLLALVAERAGRVRPDVPTSDPAVAAEFILGEFGWPLEVPRLASARLVGVGVDALADGVEIPVLRYVTSGGEPLTVFAYDYAFLDAAAGRVRLAPAVYARLADAEALDVRRAGDAYLVVWRRRAAIYTAITPSDPAALVEELRRAGG